MGHPDLSAAERLRAAVDACGLDDDRVVRAADGELWARGWSPPPMTVRAAVGEVAAACAAAAALDPLEALDPLKEAGSLLTGLSRAAPALRAVVAGRVSTYADLSADTVAYHLSSLADGLGWGEQLAAEAGRATTWEQVGPAARWAEAIGGLRASYPRHGELGTAADLLVGWVADAAFARRLEPGPRETGAEAPPGVELPPGLAAAAVRPAVVLGAAVLRAVALDLPAMAALAAGAAHADGLRLVGRPAPGVAAMIVSSQPELRRIVVEQRLVAAEERAERSAREVAAAYRAHPRGGHYPDPAPDVNDVAAMDAIEDALAEAGEMSATVAAEPDVGLGAMRADVARCAQSLRAPRGWGAWDEQAYAAAGLTRLCVRLAAAQAIARRDA